MLGKRVTLKSITDLYEDGTLVDKELDFQGGRLNDKHTIILLPEEQKYLGQSGTVVAYSHNVSFLFSFMYSMTTFYTFLQCISYRKRKEKYYRFVAFLGGIVFARK